MTRIVVTRSGGFAGITRTTEVTEPDAVERILELLRAHPAADAPPRPDGFVYDFAVEQESGTAEPEETAETAEPAETYSIPESTLPADLRALLG
jgi:hypothetical protein